MAKLIEITGKALSGEWGTDDINGDGIPVLRTTNFTNEGVVNYKDVVTRIIKKKNIDEKYLRLGDILIEKSGGSDKFPVGRVIYFDGPEKIYLFNNFTGLLRVKDQRTWYPKYIFYSLFANYKRGGTRLFENKTTGLHNLKIDNYVSKYDINELNMEKQINICNKLDKLYGIVKLRQEELKHLETLIKSRFVEMFGDPIANQMEWPIKTLKELSTLITNGNTPKGGSQNYIESGITFLRSQNVWRNRIDLDDVAYIDETIHQRMKKSSLHYKDILITKTGRINTENSSLGRAALFLGNDNSANINGHVYLIRLTDEVIPEYVVTILTGEAYRKYIRKVCVGGIDKRQINVDQVENFPIIMPPIELQQQFVDFVAQVNKYKIEVQKSLDETQTLFDSLMQKYFG
jgi:type I restriction enzyme S subunit